MISPGVENTLGGQPGHERQVSKDTQATLIQDVVDANPDDHRRSRKRAVSDDGDDDQGSHDAKRFRVTAETSAAPPTATTTANVTGLPTAAAPQNISEFTTVAPAAVDPNHDANTDSDEVLSDDEDDVAAPAQGGGRPTTSADYDDEDLVLPTCVWTTLEPAALAYGIRPNYVDESRTPWRLTIIPPAPGRGALNNVQVTHGLPTCVWVRLGPKHYRYERKPEWADEDGCAWRLVLFPPPYTAAAATSEDEDETSDDESSGSEQVPFIAEEEECDCCCCRGCCCCCRGCWCCELATTDDEFTTSDDELTSSDDAPSGPELYTWTRLGPAFLGFDRYADVVDRDGVAWRRDLLTPPCTDVSSEEGDVSEEEDQASEEDDGAQEAVQRSDADIEDDDVFEDAGATDSSDGGLDYDDEDELEYAD